MTNEELTIRYEKVKDRLENMFMHLMNANTQTGDLDTRQFHRDQARYEREKIAGIFKEVMGE